MQPVERLIELNQPDFSKIISLIDYPVHQQLRRANCRPDLTGKLNLDVGYYLSEQAGVITDDFCEFMKLEMSTLNSSAGIPIVWSINPKLRMSGKFEHCRIFVTKEKVEIEAEDKAALSRAFLNIESEMHRNNYPSLRIGESYDSTFERIRMSRSPIASYRFGSGWELNHEADFYPKNYLNTLRHARINAVWVAGLFREMMQSDVFPEVTALANEKSLRKLRKLTETAAEYGIKVYLFCMEPRSLLPDNEIFRKYPEVGGTSCGVSPYDIRTLCTSHPLTLAYLEEAIGKLFQNVPQLGGLMQIFAGERATSCHSIDAYVGPNFQPCQVCSAMNQVEALSKLIKFQFNAIKKVSPKADYIVWSYGLPQNNIDIKCKIYESIPEEVIWLENFEHDLSKKFFEHVIYNEEYSLSCIGPTPHFSEIANLHLPHQPSVWPKFQMGNTYEMPLVPYIPVPSMVYRKQKAARDLGCDGAVVSWIIGGWGDVMLQAFGMSTSVHDLGEEKFLHQLAAMLYPKESVAAVVTAWQIFDHAFQQYPCDKDIYYYGPIARSPGYLLQFDEEYVMPRYTYNWGIDRERHLQPYYTPTDSRWTGKNLNPMEIAMQFRKISNEFGDGVTLLNGHPGVENLQNIAKAIQIIFDSAANVYEFYELRHSEEHNRLLTLCHKEIINAGEMIPLLESDPRIGFQSELYFFPVTVSILNEKIRHTQKIIDQLIKGGNYE